MEATTRPLPEPPAVDDPRPSSPRGRRLLVVGLVLLGLLVAGIVVGGRLLDDPRATRTDFRFVVPGLGEEWRAVAAKDEGVDTGPPFPGAYTILLGTHDDPTAPAIELAWRTDDTAPTFDALAQSSGMEPVPAARRRASCAPLRDGTTLCYLDERGRGLQLRANGVPSDEVLQVIDAVGFDGERPTVDAAALPEDLQVLVDGTNAGIGLVANGNADHPSVASVLYTGPGSSTAILVVGDAAVQELAYGGAFNQWERERSAGRDWFVSTSGEGTNVLWIDGGRTFWLRVSPATIPEGLAAAASVRAATEAEWTAIPERPQWDGPPVLTG